MTSGRVQRIALLASFLLAMALLIAEIIQGEYGQVLIRVWLVLALAWVGVLLRDVP